MHAPKCGSDSTRWRLKEERAVTHGDDPGSLPGKGPTEGPSRNVPCLGEGQPGVSSSEALGGERRGNSFSPTCLICGAVHGRRGDLNKSFIRCRNALAQAELGDRRADRASPYCLWLWLSGKGSLACRGEVGGSWAVTAHPPVPG